ncbi:hypothetical protein [Paenibacillus glycanilyticus]|uniref:YhfM-like domain-containing protein n=1 Tax=Paenibacillus glycanilyticus TaxID=126569 RepID=A0ABQ6GG45_9BACL|nr:hypothetical protein [Paenibacillus glycanilyticus]GLX68017.1 hypothetical protein MU1_23620 [Paenibacillus glycanilyticus]
MKFRVFVLLFAIVFAMTGCTSEKIQQIIVYKMISFQETDQISVKVFRDSSDISVFSKAFKHATKNSGIADMADPQYKVEMGKETYFLWLTDEAGTIENVNNTNVTYTLSKKSAGEVYQLLLETSESK